MTEDKIRTLAAPFHSIYGFRDVEFARALMEALASVPIDMVLHCPKCGVQHIDEPDTPYYGGMTTAEGFAPRWDNPPHRSHLCIACGHIWRPADVATNGVRAVKTKGQNDSEIVEPILRKVT